MLEEIIHGISDFGTWNFADRIRFFSWYAAVSGSEPFSPADIGLYFDQLRVKKPSAIGPFLRAMTRGGRPELIVTWRWFSGGAGVLESLQRTVREDAIEVRGECEVAGSSKPHWRSR